MATSAVAAREPKADSTAETVETASETRETVAPQPATFKQRIAQLLHRIFQGREDHLGWHQ